MSEFIFSLNRENSEFSWPARGVSVVCGAGYQQITAGLATSGVLSDYDVEMMIYRIEEIIESDAAIQPIGGDASVYDSQFSGMRKAFLGEVRDVDRHAIEAAFNRFADTLSYGHYPVNSAQLEEIARFIFIRELSHHLDVRHVLFI